MSQSVRRYLAILICLCLFTGALCAQDGISEAARRNADLKATEEAGEILKCAAINAASSVAGKLSGLLADAAETPGGPLKPGEVLSYDEFNKRSRKFGVGDDLEGHEVWQHRNLQEHKLATTRNSTPASKNNIVLVVDKATHAEYTKAQRAIDAANQTPRQNIVANIKLLKQFKVSDEILCQLLTLAFEHAASLGF